MRHLLKMPKGFVLVCLFGVFGLANSPAFATTQGYKECVEDCYVRECGEVGIRCPTVTQKRMYRRKCQGYCVEKMRRQADEREWRAFQRRQAMMRARSAEIRKNLLFRHNLWMQKRQLVAKIRLQYLDAKRNGSSQTLALMRKMHRSHLQQMAFMQQKLRAKEQFYASRREMRSSENREMIRQLKKLRQRLSKAKTQKSNEKVAQFRKQIKERQQQAQTARKKSALLEVNYIETRVQRHKHAVKKVKTERKIIKQEQTIAKKEKNKQKLAELAKRLGALAGQQAAFARKAELDQIKLTKAKTMLTSLDSNDSTSPTPKIR